MISQYYYHYFQYLCLILSLVFYKSLKKHSLGLLMPLTILACVVEAAARYYKYFGLSNNYGINSCFMVPSVFIYYAIFGKLIKMNRWQARFYWTVAISTMIFALIDGLILSYGQYVQTTATIAMSQHVLLSIWLLAQITFDESKTKPLSSEPYFWFSAGLMIFSIGASIFFGLRQYIFEHKLMVNGKTLYSFFGPIINVVLYSCYSVVAYLCYRNEKQELAAAKNSV